MAKDIFYVVNNDSTTSIPLEVAGSIEKKHSNFTTVVYYDSKEEVRSNFTDHFISVGAKGILDINALIKTVHLIRNNKPEVIHAHHTWSAFLFFLFAHFFSSTSTLIKTEHNDHRYFKWYQTILNFFILLMADKVLCNSQSTLNSFSKIEKIITKGQTKISYNGVNIEQIRNTKLSEKERNYLIPNLKDSFLIGSVGRFVEQKNYECLLDAFSLIRKQSSFNIKLILVGDGKLKDELIEKAEINNIREHVIFTGMIDRRLVFGLLSEIDVYVMPSKWEGFCNALVEALAAKKAAVCSNIDTLKEVANGSALFAENDNPEDFANKILSLLSDKELKEKFEKKAAKRSEYLSLQACAERYITQYSENRL